MAFSIYDLKIITAYFVVVAAAFGLVMGSFLHCVAWRVVRGEDFLKGRSRCPACGHILTPGELVPVFSYFVQKGRCRSCQCRIPVRYPLSELAFATLTVLTLMRFDLTIVCARNFVFLCCLFCLTLTDLDDQIIPDGCHVIAAAAWGLAAAIDFPGWRETGLHFLTALAAGGGVLGVSLVMDRVMGRDTMGGGDIKLIAVAGLYLGPVGTLFMLMLACVLGLLGAYFLQKRNRRKQAGQIVFPGNQELEQKEVSCKEAAGKGDSGIDAPDGKAFPFGPALAVATYLMLLYGEPVIGWYMRLL